VTTTRSRRVEPNCWKTCNRYVFSLGCLIRSLESAIEVGNCCVRTQRNQRVDTVGLFVLACRPGPKVVRLRPLRLIWVSDASSSAAASRTSHGSTLVRFTGWFGAAGAPGDEHETAAASVTSIIVTAKRVIRELQDDRKHVAAAPGLSCITLKINIFLFPAALGFLWRLGSDVVTNRKCWAKIGRPLVGSFVRRGEDRFGRDGGPCGLCCPIP
jgi:hypothetical protein